MIPVTKPYFPDRRKYQQYLEGIYERECLTNNGPLVRELTERLEDHLGVRNLLLVANGGLALQVAFKAVGLKGSVITTPFSFAATTSTLVWEGLTPVYGDVDSFFNLDPEDIEPRVTPDVSGILPVHVYGMPCNVEAIERVAAAKGLNVVYDAAHAFGVTLNRRSILTWGDASILSFHATKLFHTVEGGAIVFRDATHLERARRLINFGLPATSAGMIPEIGINAKLSEVHAAMGLCVLDDIDLIVEARQSRIALYRELLGGHVDMLPQAAENVGTNGAYMPIFLKGAGQRDAVAACLADAGVTTRRYFWPSLETAFSPGMAPTATRAARAADTALSLPLYVDLAAADIRRICALVAGCVARADSSVELGLQTA